MFSSRAGTERVVTEHVGDHMADDPRGADCVGMRTSADEGRLCIGCEIPWR